MHYVLSTCVVARKLSGIGLPACGGPPGRPFRRPFVACRYAGQASWPARDFQSRYLRQVAPTRGGATSIPEPSCRPAKRQRNAVIYGHGTRHALRSIENLETHHVSACVVVQDDAGLILIAFRNRRVAQQDAEHVNFRVVYYFHSALQYFSILLVR